MDKLEAEIAKAKREAAELRRQAEAKELEARALQRAAKLRPLPEVDTNAIVEDFFVPAEEGEKPSTGRQRGAISKPWRNVLAGIYAGGKNEPVDITGIILLADVAGMEIGEGTARARMRAYIEQGFIEENDRKFRVTPVAVERFSLAPDDPADEPLKRTK